MPIYEYHCMKCNNDFEYLVMGNAAPDCPACNSKKVKRLMSACGFVSKGNNGDGSTASSSTSSSCGSCSAASCTGCSHG